MNWGYRVTILYIGFVLFMLTLVFMSFRYDVNLVAKDYYQQELAYQQEINKIANAQGLIKASDFKYNPSNRCIEFTLPLNYRQGEIHFFRPSDRRKDFRLSFKNDSEGRQWIPVRAIERGLWRLKINWKDQSKDYFFEQKIQVKDDGTVAFLPNTINKK